MVGDSRGRRTSRSTKLVSVESRVSGRLTVRTQAGPLNRMYACGRTEIFSPRVLVRVFFGICRCTSFRTRGTSTQHSIPKNTSRRWTNVEMHAHFTKPSRPAPESPSPPTRSSVGPVGGIFSELHSRRPVTLHSPLRWQRKEQDRARTEKRLQHVRGVIRTGWRVKLARRISSSADGYAIPRHGSSDSKRPRYSLHVCAPSWRSWHWRLSVSSYHCSVQGYVRVYVWSFIIRCVSALAWQQNEQKQKNRTKKLETFEHNCRLSPFSSRACVRNRTCILAGTERTFSQKNHVL